MSSDQKFIVRGVVLLPSEKPAPRVVVRAFDKGLRRERLLGEARPDETGQYEIRYAPKKALGKGRTPIDLVVRVVDASGRLHVPLAESPVRFRAASSETIDLVVDLNKHSAFEWLATALAPILDGVPLADLSERDIDFIAAESGADRARIAAVIANEVVSGRITTPSALPAAGVLVQAFHCRRETAKPISAEVSTNGDGRYRVVIDPVSLKAVLGSDVLNLQIRTHRPGAQGDGWSSEVRYAAALPATVDVTIPEEVGPTRFEIISGQLKTLGKKITLKKLDEPKTREWLAGTANLDVNAVRQVLTAHELSAKAPGLPAEAIYALLSQPAGRTGKPVAQKLQEAVGKGIVGKEVLKHVGAADVWLKERVIDARVTALSTPASAGAPSGLAEILKAAKVPGDAIKKYVRVVAEHAGKDPAAVDHEVQKVRIPAAARAVIGRAHRLTQLVGADAPLVGSLIGALPKRERNAERAIATLAGWSRADWERHLSKTTKKTGRVTHAIRERARELQAVFERTYPKEALLGSLDAASPSAKNGAELAGIRKALIRHDIDLRGKTLRSRPTKAMKGMEPRIAERLGNLQRLSHVAPFEHALGLLTKGHTSARSIAAMNRDGFVRQMAKANMSAAEAAAIHRRSTSQSAAAVAMAAGLSPQYVTTSPAAIFGVTLPAPKKKNADDSTWSAAKTVKADLETLFGSPDACSVAPCQSVIGQAAYLVDLLEMLDHAGGTAVNARDVLLDRRRDLGEIELSCHNADTPLPYIDLVIELLEEDIAPRYQSSGKSQAAGFGNALPGKASRGFVPMTSMDSLIEDSLILGGRPKASAGVPYPQTTWLADELAALPEYLNEKAYEKLSTAVFPWILPFSLPHEEAETYLADLELNRGELLRRVRRRPASGWERPEALEMACACLRIGPTERAIITAGLVQYDAALLKESGLIRVAGATQYPATVDGATPVKGDVIAVRGINRGNLSLYKVVAERRWELLRTLAPGELVVIRRGDSRAGTAWLALPTFAMVLGSPKSEEHTPGLRDLSGVVDGPWRYWGYPDLPATWPDTDTRHVRTLLDRTGLAYADLIELLLTEYINPESNGQRPVVLVPESGSDGCDLTRTRIAGVDQAFLNRFHRFVRLRRRLGWTIRDVDRAVHALQPHDLTDVFLIQIAEVKAVSDRLKLPIADVLTFWGNLDTQPHFDRTATPPKPSRSQYERLLRDRAKLSEADRQKLALKSAATTLLSNVSGPVSAALGLSAQDYRLLTEQGPDRDSLCLGAAPVPASTRLLPGASALYRWQTLANAVNLPIRDLLRLQAITGIKPFVSPDSTSRLLDAVDSMRACGLTVDDLDFLLRHVADPERTRRFEEDALKLLRRVRDQVFGTGPLVSRGAMCRALQAVLDGSADFAGNSADEAAGIADILEGAGILAQDALTSNKPAVRLITGRILTVGEVRTALDAITRALAVPADPIIRKLVRQGTPESVPGAERRGVLMNKDPIAAALIEPAMVREIARASKVSNVVLRMLLDQVHAAAWGAAPGLYPIAHEVRLGDNLADVDTFRNSPAWQPYARLAKAAWLADRLRFVRTDLDHDGAIPPQHPFRLLLLNDLPALPVEIPSDSSGRSLFESWKAFSDLVELRRRLATRGLSFWDVREAAARQSGLNASWLEAARQVGGPADEIDKLIGPNLLALDVAAGDAQPGVWLRFLDTLDLVARLGVSPSRLRDWAGDSLALKVSADIRATAAARRGFETWQKLAPQLRNGLREKQRAALLAYVVAKAGAENVDAVQSHFLVDVEMGSKQLTTRLGLAVASVQRFVQRALLGVETNRGGTQISFDGDFKKSWEWMKSYRTWRDNRKLFLYPENFLLPEIRDDKSPFFLEIEQLLSQRDLNDEAIEDAVIGYLQKLDDVARMEIMGTCTEDTIAGRILHIVARTRSTPYQYYQRTWNFASAQFLPWRRLDLDIDGDWAVPMIVDGRLNLYWIKHVRQIEGMKDTIGLVEARPFPLQLHYPMYQDQYSLSWSTRVRKGWTPKKSSDHCIARPFFPFVPADFAVRVDEVIVKQEDGVDILRQRLKIGGVTLFPQLPAAFSGGGNAEGGSGAIVHGTPQAQFALSDLPIIGPILQGNGGSSSGGGGGFNPAGIIAELLNVKKAIEQIWNTIPDFEGEHSPLSPQNKALLHEIRKGVETLTTLLSTVPTDGTFPQWVAGKTFGAVFDAFAGLVTRVIEILNQMPSSLLKDAKLLDVNVFRPIFDALEEARLGVSGPAFGLEFGFFDVGPAGVKTLRLSPPPDLTSLMSAPLSAFGWVAAMATSALSAFSMLLYSLFPGYPGFHDVPVQAGRLCTNLALGSGGARGRSVRAWPGTGYFPFPSGGGVPVLCTLWINLAKIAEEEAQSLGGDLAGLLGTDAGGLGGLLDSVLNFPANFATLAEDELEKLGSMLNVGMRVVQPLPFAPYPDRLDDPPPTIVSEDRHGRTFLLNPVRYKNIAWQAIPLYHPLTAAMNRELERTGVAGLYELASPSDGYVFRYRNTAAFSDSFQCTGSTIDTSLAGEELELTPTGAYTIYNWELFYHLPMLLGARFVTQQKFDQALKWYRTIFDPTISSGSAPQRYWRFKPFYKEYEGTTPLATITKWLKELAGEADETGLQGRERLVRAWQHDPFNPHLVARLRPGAYERATVMRTVEALVSWGDARFREATWESINEATQLYLLARDILGKRPDLVPARPAKPLTYNGLRKEARAEGTTLDAFGNALLKIEAALDSVWDSPDDQADPADSLVMLSGVSMLYFGIPTNDKLLGYWDTVDDRLYKIRHSLDIRGKARPAFSLEGDAAGDIAMALASSEEADQSESLAPAPLPPYRFPFMAQKANEFAGDVKALGGALLAALEKRDAEAMALLRSGHEIQLLQAAERVRQLQIDEAQRSLDAVRQSKEGAALRHAYYTSREFLNAAEGVKEALSVVSSGLQIASGVQELAAAVLHALPEIQAGVAGVFSSPGVAVKYGASQLGNAVSSMSRAFSIMASMAQTGSGMAGTLASYQRRQEEWDHQAALADNDMEQFDRQIQSAEKRLEIAQREIENHRKQVANAQEVSTFMHEKFSSEELYDWMVGQASAAHFQAYLLAVDLARRAETCYRFERAEKTASFVRVEQPDSLAKALLSGERLQGDLRRMEVAYLDTGSREYELTKHVSLKQVDPVALLMLQQKGECYVALGERLFDADHPGHYLRRLKTVGLSIPCIAGPYTSVNCRLTLVDSRTRVKPTIPTAPDKYPEGRVTPEDRFDRYPTCVTAIATSTGQNDSGMFELNLRDERYLPFEGEGAISTWRIELPLDTNRLDFSTISDVILHLRYTARDGGPQLRDMAWQATFPTEPPSAIDLPTPPAGLFRVFSARNDFPDSWYRFLNPQSDDAVLDVDLSASRFPYHREDQDIAISEFEIVFVTPAGESADQLKATFTHLDDNKRATPVDRRFEEKERFSGLASKTLTPQGEQTTGAWQLRITRNGNVNPQADILNLPAASDAVRVKPESLNDVLIFCSYAVN